MTILPYITVIRLNTIRPKMPSGGVAGMITIKYILSGQSDCEGWVERKFNTKSSLHAWIARNSGRIELLWFVK
jgi:hypothetical protein